MKARSCRRLTIKDRAGEKHQEFDEQIFLLGGDFVPAEALPSVLDIGIADALLDVGLKPFLGHGAVFFRGFIFLTAPEL